jgi:hypothetical protein
MATRTGPFRSHSGELRRSGRAVRKARNGNPSTSECCSPWSSPRHEAIKFNSVESTVRYLGIESTTLSPKPTD